LVLATPARKEGWRQAKGTDVNTLNLRQLGLALLAIFAFGGIAASSAFAVEDKFHSSVEPTVMTAASEQTTVFGFNGGKFKVECKKATLAGTFKTMVAMEIETHPTFKECSNGIYDREECVIRLTGRTNANKDAAIELGCPGTNEMTFTTEICNFHIPPQTMEGVSYTNGKEETTQKKDVTIKFTVTNVIYHKVPVVLNGCNTFGGAGEGKDGTVTGAFTATGYEDIGGAVENGDEFKEGAVVDFFVE
jgi:hypothetical protein